MFSDRNKKHSFFVNFSCKVRLVLRLSTRNRPSGEEKLAQRAGGTYPEERRGSIRLSRATGSALRRMPRSADHGIHITAQSCAQLRRCRYNSAGRVRFSRRACRGHFALCLEGASARTSRKSNTLTAGRSSVELCVFSVCMVRVMVIDGQKRSLERRQFSVSATGIEPCAAAAVTASLRCSLKTAAAGHLAFLSLFRDAMPSFLAW